MTIRWVEIRLVRWGEFMGSGGDSMRGGGSTFPAYQMVHVQDDGMGSSMPISDEILETDAALGKIKVEKPKLFDVAFDWYASGLSAQTIAGRHRCHLDTVYERKKCVVELVANIISKRVSARVFTNM